MNKKFLRNSHLFAALSLILVLLLSVNTNVMAGDFNYESWQLARIFTPDTKALRTESKQQVFIFDGLKDKDVDRAMDVAFERVENFMFVSTVVTDEEGEVMHDPLGRLVLEDDDCDF